jgi:hypothetical protein
MCGDISATGTLEAANGSGRGAAGQAAAPPVVADEGSATVMALGPEGEARRRLELVIRARHLAEDPRLGKLYASTAACARVGIDRWSERAPAAVGSPASSAGRAARNSPPRHENRAAVRFCADCGSAQRP